MNKTQSLHWGIPIPVERIMNTYIYQAVDLCVYTYMYVYTYIHTYTHVCIFLGKDSSLVQQRTYVWCKVKE